MQVRAGSRGRCVCVWKGGSKPFTAAYKRKLLHLGPTARTTVADYDDF